MAPAHANLANCRTVLRLGSAAAVLIDDAPAEVTARDALASASLQRVTGQSEIVIARRSSGRPCLAPPYCELGVSLSRRGSLLLAGFSGVAPIGVDLEVDDGAPSLDPVRLARDHFAPGEARAVAALPPTDARDMFLRLWVAKEAVLKATGRGIVDGLHQPNFAAQMSLLRADPAFVQFSWRHGFTCAIARITKSVSSAYCALAVMGQAGSSDQPEQDIAQGSESSP